MLRGTVACTGNRGCKYAATDTKTHAVELANLLDARFKIEQPVNLHVTGCPHSCAQHYIGDIGLLGMKVGGEEGYQVVIGGGSDQDKGLARELIPAIAIQRLPPVMERLFRRLQRTAQCAMNPFSTSAAGTASRNCNRSARQRSKYEHAANIPFIPDNAPFTPEQRAWLNGFLPELFSPCSAACRAEAKPSLRIAILYASQSGTAEGLARKLAKELKAQGHQPAVSTLVGYTPAALAAEKYALILASTYGEGEAPDGVQPFYEAALPGTLSALSKDLSYAVFALGDRHYENFCKFGKRP